MLYIPGWPQTQYAAGSSCLCLLHAAVRDVCLHIQPLIPLTVLWKLWSSGSLSSFGGKTGLWTLSFKRFHWAKFLTPAMLPDLFKHCDTQRSTVAVRFSQLTVLLCFLHPCQLPLYSDRIGSILQLQLWVCLFLQQFWLDLKNQGFQFLL